MTIIKAQLSGSAIALHEAVAGAAAMAGARLTIRSLLSRHHLSPVMTPAVEARDAVVPVICMRK